MRFADIFLLLCARVLGLSTYESEYHSALNSRKMMSPIARYNLAVIRSTSSKEFQAKTKARKADTFTELKNREREVRAIFSRDTDPYI